MEDKHVFEVGDKVVAIRGTGNHRIKEGMQGVVKHLFESDNENIGVEYSEFINGHNLNGNGEEGHGWYTPARALKLDTPKAEIEQFTVVLEGKRTTVTLADGSVGTSKPIDKDEYSLEKGILIAKEKAHIESKKRQAEEILAEGETIAEQINELNDQLAEKAHALITLGFEAAIHQAEVLRIGG